jgi:preprotein translocase subunit SecE
MSEEGAAAHMSEKKPRWYKRFWAFLKEARAELKKVTWPSREEVMNTTIVVIVLTVFFGFYLFFMDVVFSWALTKLKDLVG